MNAPRPWLLVALAMLAFAGNSILCRVALREGAIDAASFTTVRLVSGAAVLWALVAWRQRRKSWGRSTSLAGDFASALALFIYAAGFSMAYLSMTAATGALLLFGSVQATMISIGLWRGERLAPLQWAGFALAVAGVGMLMVPGVAAPAAWGAAAMVCAGVAWGVYSLLGKRFQQADPVEVTAGNFVRAAPMALFLSAVMASEAHLSAGGVWLALASGIVTSGLGYAIWYRVLPALQASQAATVQLSVPLLAALGGVAFVGEALTWPLAAAGLAIVGGIAMVLRTRTVAT